MKNIVSLDWLSSRIGDPGFVIVDCRFELGQPAAGREAYMREHIPGAVYADLEKDMSGPVEAHGGRHPLPDLGPFSQMLGGIGIDAATTVVAYDDQGGAYASRFWWMVKFLGHERVYVLDRGFSAWKAAGGAVTAEIPIPAQKAFSAQIRTEMLVSMDDVKRRLNDDGALIIDSRDAARYAGKVEPLDPVAGHIPGAKNAFWKMSLQEDGSWKGPEEQKRRFSGVGEDEEIIVYCGSGVTACPNVIALMEAGFMNVKLYSGSWSDWISYEDNPIATGEE